VKRSADIGRFCRPAASRCPAAYHGPAALVKTGILPWYCGVGAAISPIDSPGDLCDVSPAESAA